MKMNIWKRLLSLALALVMVAGWMPHMATEAYAAAPIKLEGTTYAYEPGQGFYIWLNCACSKCLKDFNSFTNYDTHKYEITSYSYSISGGNYSISVSGNFTGCNGTAAFSRTLSGTFSCTDELYNESPSVAIYTGSTRVGSISLRIGRNTSDHQGDATCVTADNCNLCGTSYTNTSNHEKPDEFTYSVNTADSTKHDKKYACCGAVAETTDHSYTYTADGFVLTEKCTNGCGHQAIASIVAGEAIYTGSEITDAATISYDSGTWAGDAPVLSFENNVTVGTATAKMTAGDATASTTFKINPASLSYATVELNPASGTYTGSYHNRPTYTLTYNGKQLVENTDYTVEGEWTGDFLNAGDNTLLLTGTGNFTGTKLLTYNIGKADPTADLFQMTPPENAVYDGTTAHSATVTSSVVGMGEITVKYNGSEDAPINAGTYTVTVYVADGVNYNGATSIELGSFTVAPANGSASVSVADVEYGDAVIPIPVSSTNGTDHVTYQYKVQGADDSTYTNEVPTAVGSYTVKATFAATNNYKMAEATADFTVSKRPITVTANDASKTYGGTDPELEWTVTSGTVLASDPLSVNISRVAGENAGDYTITVGQDEGANPNYDITFVNGTLTIHKASLTVIVKNQEIVYGDEIGEIIAGFDGFIDTTHYTTQLDFSNEVRTSTYKQYDDVGTYPITVSGITSNNYEITYVPGTLTVNPKPITVTIADKTGVYGEAVAELTAATDGIVNNDTNVYSLATTATSTTAVGSYAITGTRVDTNYDITFVDGTYTIFRAPVNSTGTDMTVSYTAGMEVDLRQMFTIDENAGEADYWITHLTGDGSFTGAPYLYRIGKAGTFTVKITTEETANYNSGTATAVLTVNPGDPGIGAVTAGVVNNTVETAAIDLTRANTDVDGNLTVDAGQSLAWGENTIRYTFTPDNTNYKTVTGTVAVTVVDTIAPTGTVNVSTKSWAEFLNNITFGLFFKETQTVSVTASDNLSGVATIEYYETKDILGKDDVAALDADKWTAMNSGSVSVTAEDAKQFIYYIRITDKAGNITYLSTDGAEFDTSVPVIGGIENGKTYYTTQKVTVTDKYIDSITLNGETASTNITLDGNKDAAYTIVVTDKAGNSTTITVNMKPISDLAAPIDNLTKGNVNSSNEQAVDGVKAAVAEVDTTNATEAEKAAVKDITDKAAELEKVTDDTKTEIARITEEVNKFNGDTVNSDDAAALAQLGKDIKALTDGGNLANAERAALTENAGDVAAWQKIITDTAAENDRISDAVDGHGLATVTSDDKEELEQLLADINKQLESTNLTEEEVSERKGEKKAVEALLAKIAGTDELIDNLTEDVNGYSEDTVKSTDQEAIEQVIEDIDALLETENLTEDEKKALEDAKADAEVLMDVIETAREAADTKNAEKVENVSAENVKLKDKEALENAKADLEKALKDYGSNYTKGEKKAIRDEIQRIEDALEALENVEDVTEAITRLPKTVEPDDEEAAEKILNAKEAYDVLTSHEKSLVKKSVQKKLNNLVDALTAYDIIKGDGSKWTQSSNGSLRFTANGPFSKFVGIEVDGREVDEKYYEAKAGSTIITLKQSYLEKLSAGKHTITVVYTDGEADGTFTVAKAADPDAPATGDDFNVMLYGAMLTVSLAAMVVLLFTSRKRKQTKS